MTPPVVEGRRRARALTVFQSPKIERFDIELMGDLPDGGVAGIDLILGRAYGPKIDELGGVPAGASGSPVYVGERLIGAVAYVFSPDYRLVGITPIEAMRRLALEPRPKDGVLPAATVPRRETAAAPAAPDERLGLPGPAWPAGTAPAAYGFRSPAGRRALKERFAVEPIPAGPMAAESALLAPRAGVSQSPPLEPVSGAAGPPKRPFVPGSPFGIALIDGDVRLGAIGTVTSVEGDAVLGLGHPAFFAGAVRLPLHEATIVTTAGGQGPVKVGYLGKTAGAVVQDRSAGILGEIGDGPERVEMAAEVTDTDRHVREVLRVGLAPLATWVPALAFLVAIEAFARAMNRIGPGEAVWAWTARLEGRPEPVRREATDRSPDDIAGLVARAGEAFLGELVLEGEVVRKVALQARAHR